jgi:hypothetical protein
LLGRQFFLCDLALPCLYSFMQSPHRE